MAKSERIERTRKEGKLTKTTNQLYEKRHNTTSRSDNNWRVFGIEENICAGQTT